MKKEKEFVLLVDGVEVKCSTASKMDVELPKPRLRMAFKINATKIYQLEKLTRQIDLVHKRYFNELSVDITAGHGIDDFPNGKITILMEESLSPSSV